MLQKLNEKKYLILTFLIAFIPRVLMCINETPLNAIPDELGTIAAGAYYAGLDWSGIMPYVSYYGTGFTFLFSPLFRLTSNPFIIYKTILISCCFLQSLVVFISYYILKHHFEIKNEKVACFIALICSYMTVTKVKYVFNEHPIILLVWVEILMLTLLQKNINSIKTKRLLTIFLMLILGYSISLHERNIVMWGAAIVTIIYYYYVYRKWLVSLPIAIGLGGSAYLICEKYVDYIQNNLWLKGTVKEILYNSTVPPLNTLYLLKDIKNWHAWINIIIGEISTISVITGGIFVVAVIFAVKIFWSTLFKKNAVFVNKPDDFIEKSLITITFTISSIAVIILMMSIYWLEPVVTAFHTGVYDNSYHLKAYTYVRYFGPFCSPLIMIVCVAIYRYKDKLKEYLKIGFIFLLLIHIFWVFCILPYISHINGQVGPTYVPFSLMEYTDEGRALLYLPATLITLIMYIIIWRLCDKRKIKELYTLIFLLLFYQYAYYGIKWNSEVYYLANSGYEYFYDLGYVNSNSESQNIYVLDKRQAMEYQFMLNRCHIIWGLPSEENLNSYIIADSLEREEIPSLVESGYSIQPLDENEYLLYK